MRETCAFLRHLFLSAQGRTVVIFAILFSLPLIITNGCGKPFQASFQTDNFSQGKSSLGAQLYKTNCQSCHGELAASTKRGRTAEDIRVAIESYPQMASLSSLGNDKIEAIAQALQLKTDSNGQVMVYQCTQPMARGTSVVPIRRLTKSQLANSLSEIFGAEIYQRVASTLLQIPEDTIEDSFDSEFIELHKMTHAQALTDFGEQVAEILVDDVNTRETLISLAGSCATQQNLSDACINSFIQKFGRKVLRRPLNAAEAQTYKSTFDAAPTDRDGLKILFSAFIQHPNFLFHIELGDPESIQQGRMKLTPFEVASRLSFQLIGTTPDEELLDAAAQGQLDSVEAIAEHARRLLKKPVAQKHIQEFFSYWLQLNRVAAPDRTSLERAQLNTNANNLRSELVQELKDFTEHVVFTSNGSYMNLLTSPATFPRSRDLATVVMTSIWDGSSQPPESQTHKGILMRPALLVSGIEETRPIMRGLTIRTRILCDPLSSPDDEAVDNRIEEVGELSPLEFSLRERVTTLTEPSSCASCHAQINPLGFPLEAFDQLGMWRTAENVYNDNNEVIATHPLDLQVKNPRIIEGQDLLYGPDELARAVGSSYKGPACLAKHVYSFSRFADPKAADHCALSEMEAILKSPEGSILEMLVRSVANEDIFWKGL